MNIDTCCGSSVYFLLKCEIYVCVCLKRKGVGVCVCVCVCSSCADVN